MAPRQGDVALLDDPVAQALLSSREPARLAYTWTDGSPRVVPIWFTWTGQQVVMAGPPDAPKGKALRRDPRVAITIDQATSWPYKVLLIRGRAEIGEVPGIPPEYAQAATRYFGPEQGAAWLEQIAKLGSSMLRIAVTPEWVSIVDFEHRFPSAIARKLAAAQG
jgi:PPOX class probable F420-dependent enzyme